MKKRKTKANIFFLDCCRTFVYDESRGGSPKPTTSSTRLLDNTLYAYATAPGHPDSDGHDGHGTMSRRGKGCVSRVTLIVYIASARFHHFARSLHAFVCPNRAQQVTSISILVSKLVNRLVHCEHSSPLDEATSPA